MNKRDLSTVPLFSLLLLLFLVFGTSAEQDVSVDAVENEALVVGKQPEQQQYEHQDPTTGHDRHLFGFFPGRWYRPPAAPQSPLGNCAGNCNANHRNCNGGLYCYQRQANDSVPGCIESNLDATDIDYCVIAPTNISDGGGSLPLINYGGTPMPYHFPLGPCQGDCDRDSDCGDGLVCFQRGPGDVIPGCLGGRLELSNSDYCVSPECFGDCRLHSDCDPGMYCFHANNDDDDDTADSVMGNNASIPEEDMGCKISFCVAGTPGRLIDYGGTPPARHMPLGECQGDCDNDSHCEDGLICYQRDAYESVPGCMHGDSDPSNSDYCVPPVPTNPPFYLPTPPPNDDGTISITYHPGNLTTLKDNLLLSEGLDAKLLATTDLNVTYNDQNGTASNSSSRIPFHIYPDAGATFIDTRPNNPGGWVYVSNSEEREGVGLGGVGALTFDADGNVIDYRMVLENSTWNCGGGKTPWDTWVSCEESPDGRIYQVDPFGERPGELTSIGSTIGSWESFAYDVRNATVPLFFATEDAFRGALERFTPSNPDWNDTWSILHGPGVFEYLVLVPNATNDGNEGEFYWTTNREFAKNNAAQHYPHSEGIDVYQGQMFFVCKQIKMLFVLDLDGGTYERSSSQSGLFDGGPDQLKRILDSENDGVDELLYFTEDGGVDSGVHARDDQGRFYTILESPKWPGETTGLAFSPNAKFMYVAYQMVGKLYAVWRRDGLAFDSTHLDIKYHGV